MSIAVFTYVVYVIDEITKKDGTTRILKVPTTADRAWQCLAKYALEHRFSIQNSVQFLDFGISQKAIFR